MVQLNLQVYTSSIAKFVIGPETRTFDNRALEASSMPWGAAD